MEVVELSKFLGNKFLKNFLLRIVVFSLWTTHCASFRVVNQQVLTTHLTRYFPYAPNKCFDGLRYLLEEFNINIEKKDKKTKNIITKRSIIYKYITNHDLVSYQENYFHKMFFRIKKQKNGCVIETYKYKIWNNFKQINTIDITRFNSEIWKPFFDNLENILLEIENKEITSNITEKYNEIN